MKKLFALLLALIPCLLPLSAFADGAEEVFIEEDIFTDDGDFFYENALPTLSDVSGIPAPHAILIDAASGMTLFEKEPDIPLPPASITKVMTMLLVMEALKRGDYSYDDVVTCSEYAASMGGSQIWLEVGEQMTVRELLKAVAVGSANDAAMALAEFTGGSESGFVAQMNQKAKELKMENTHFANPTGLDEEGHYSSARDIAIMSRELLKHEEILAYTGIWMDSLRDGKTSLVNTNKLVRHYRGCTGLKTGTTNGAGSCLSASAVREGLSVIAVCMGAKTSDERFASCRTMLDYSFAAFEAFTPILPADLPDFAAVKGGAAESVPLCCGELSPITVAKGKSSAITPVVELPAELIAPVKKGEQIGKVDFVLEGKTLLSVPIVTGGKAEKMTFFNALYLLISSLVCK